MVSQRAAITEKQWKDVVARLSYLEEQDSQTRDDIPSLRRLFQTIVTKVDECDKRRQDQFLALQENNVLLLQRFLSLESEIGSTVGNYERQLEQMRKDLEESRVKASRAKRRTAILEQNMSAVILSKTRKDKADKKMNLEYGRRIAVLHVQLNKTIKRVNKLKRWQLEELKVADKVKTNMLTIQSEIEKCHESNDIKMKEFSNEIVSKSLGLNTQISELRTEMRKDFEAGKQRDVHFQHGVEIRMSECQVEILRSCDESIVTKMKTIESEIESKNNSNFSQLEQNVDSLKTELLDLQTNFNSKFHENYESQLKLMSINIDRKFQDSSQNLVKIPRRVCNKKYQLLRVEFDKKYRTLLQRQSSMQSEIDKQKAQHENMEKIALRVCSEQKTLLKAEFDQKYQMLIRRQCNMQSEKERKSQSSHNETERKFREKTKTIQENEEKHLQRVCNEETTLHQAELDLEMPTQVSSHVQSDVKANRISLNNEMERMFQEQSKSDKKLLQETMEKISQRVCSEQKVLLKAELEQKFQTQMQIQRQLQSKMEENVNKQFWETNQTQLGVFKHEISNFVNKAINNSMMDLYSKVGKSIEKKFEECNTNLHSEIYTLFGESVNKQLKDLLAAIDRKIEVVNDNVLKSLNLTLVEKIAESNDSLTKIIRTGMNKQVEEQLIYLLVEVDRKCEAIRDDLLKPGRSTMD